MYLLHLVDKKGVLSLELLVAKNITMFFWSDSRAFLLKERR